MILKTASYYYFVTLSGLHGCKQALITQTETTEYNAILHLLIALHRPEDTGVMFALEIIAVILLLKSAEHSPA